MKAKAYIKDHMICIVIYGFMIMMIELFLTAFKVDYSLAFAVLIVLIIFGAVMLLYGFFRKKSFYDRFSKSLDKLDQKYLITEIINSPGFLEGQLLYEYIYEINKSMNERIGLYRNHIEGFKEYIELWIHEVKIPIAAIVLTLHNHKSEINRKVSEQTYRIENYIEQVLYYTRSENAEKDYLIKECNLETIINKVIVKNKDDFIFYKIKLHLKNLDKMVVTDAKWLAFIINQIINNSIKYRNSTQPAIVIKAEQCDRITKLSIKDNGIGISKNDINRVFDKSFTGENGRSIGTSTGMGLYICKRLCEKMGHLIQVESRQGEYTMVTISFRKDDYYQVT